MKYWIRATVRRPLFHRPTLLISIHLSLFLSTPLLPTPSMEWNEHSGPRANRSERLIAWHARRIKKRWRARCSPLTLPISSNPPPLSLSLSLFSLRCFFAFCAKCFFSNRPRAQLSAPRLASTYCSARRLSAGLLWSEKRMGGGKIGACETTRWEVFFLFFSFFLARENATIFLIFDYTSSVDGGYSWNKRIWEDWCGYIRV